MRLAQRCSVLTVMLMCLARIGWSQCPTAAGDETAFGDNAWIGYVYDGSNTFNSQNYQGTINHPTVFNTIFCGPNCDFVAETGCNVNTETFSVRFKNRQMFDCGLHTFTIGSDYGVRFSINGGSTFLINRSSGSGYATTDTTVFLTGGDYELVLEYFHVSGLNQVSFGHSEIPDDFPGEVSGDQIICNSSVNPDAFVSLSPARFCTQVAATYQWQESPDGSTGWTNIPGATSLEYDIPPGLAAGNHFYWRRAFDGTTEQFSNVISVVAENPQGDGVSFFPGVWTGYTFDGADNYSLADYRGYFEHVSQDFTESFSGVFNGCGLPPEDFSVRFKRIENIPACGGYNITITPEGGGARLFIDGALIIDGYTNVAGLTNYSANVFLSAGDHQFVLEYFNITGTSSVAFDMVASGLPGGGGVIGSDQLSCGASYNPEAFTSLRAADYCSGTFTYQWQESPDGSPPSWTDIPGATNETYDEPADLAPGTYYYRRAAIDGTEEVHSNTVVVEIIAPQGDEVTYTPGNWRGYVYDGANNFLSANYRGYFDITSLDFTEDFSAVTLNGCDFPADDFSVRFRREVTQGCGGYNITLTGDDLVRIYMDGTQLTNGFVTAYSGNVYLDGGPHDFDIEYYNATEASGINLTIAPSGENKGGGVIGFDQEICDAVRDPVTLQSVVDAGDCSLTATYQWQVASDPGGPWSDISLATNNAYNPPVLAAGVYYYRREFNDGGLNPVYSNIVKVSAFTPIGDGVTYGTDEWIGYVYDNENDFVNDFMGSFKRPTNFNETFCGSDCDFSIDGCPVQTESFSVQFRNETLFECGSYFITIGGDDGVALYVDGAVEIDGRTRQLYTTYSKTIYFDGTSPSQLDLYYYEWSFANRVSFSSVFLGPGNAGKIGTDQYYCQAGTVPDPFTSLEAASFCSGNPFTYQWQESLDGFGWTDISGANSESYTVPTALSATHYYRRQATADGYTLSSNTITVEVDPPQGDRVTYGDNAWIGYVYTYADTPPVVPTWLTADYNGYMLEPTSFDQSFCGVDCTQEIFGCDFRTQYFAVQYLNEMTLECGYYQITIAFKDGARLYIDDVVVPGLDEYWIHGPVTTLTQTVLIEDNPTSQHKFRLEFRADEFQQSIGFDIQYLGAGTPGIIQYPQALCDAPYDPVPLTSFTTPVFTCTGDITPDYQWQISADASAWSDIPGATTENYDPPSGHAFTRYYRRKESDDAGNILFTNVITILYEDDPPTHSGSEYGAAPDWIGHVYEGADNYSTNYLGSFIETMSATNAFDESFCGPDCLFPIDGCDVRTETFSVRFRTQITLPAASYTFTIGADAGVRLSIDGGATYLIEDYSLPGHSYRTASNVPIDLLGGTYDLVLDYYDNYVENRVSFSFTSTPLPVTWHYFNGYYADGSAYLEWRTASEINNAGFEVERSKDGTTFTKIGWVEGNGSTTVEQQYFFTDESPEQGWNYYRLKQIDYDENFEYSRLIPVFVDDLPQVEIYPNPLRDHIFLSRINSELPPEVTFTNMLGQRSWRLTQDPMQPSRYNLPVRLEPGVYSARIRMGDAIYTRKVIIE